MTNPDKLKQFKSSIPDAEKLVNIKIKNPEIKYAKASKLKLILPLKEKEFVTLSQSTLPPPEQNLFMAELSLSTSDHSRMEAKRRPDIFSTIRE